MAAAAARSVAPSRLCSASRFKMVAAPPQRPRPRRAGANTRDWDLAVWLLGTCSLLTLCNSPRPPLRRRNPSPRPTIAARCLLELVVPSLEVPGLEDRAREPDSVPALDPQFSAGVDTFHVCLTEAFILTLPAALVKVHLSRVLRVLALLTPSRNPRKVSPTFYR